MSEEQKDDLSGIEPAKVEFIEGQEEQQPESTLPEDSGAAEQPDGVQADTDSEGYKNIQAAFTKSQQENNVLRDRLERLEANVVQPQTHQNSFEVPSVQRQPDELDEVDKQFEELKPVNARIRKMEALLKQQQDQIANNQRDYTAGQATTAQQIHDQKILSVHPDAYTLATTPDFTGWLARQPVYVQNVTRTGNADDIISLMNTYKSSANKADAARRVASPDNTGTGTVKNMDSQKPTFTGAQIHAMSDAEFIRREDEIQLAQMEGRVLS